MRETTGNEAATTGNRDRVSPQISSRRFDEAGLLLQANARASSFEFVGGQKDNAALFERTLHEIEPVWKNIGATFVTPHGRGTDSGGLGELGRAPSKSRARHTQLRSRDTHANSPIQPLTLIYF